MEHVSNAIYHLITGQQLATTQSQLQLPTYTTNETLTSTRFTLLLIIIPAEIGIKSLLVILYLTICISILYYMISFIIGYVIIIGECTDLYLL